MEYLADIQTIRWFTLFTYCGLCLLFVTLWKQNEDISGTKEWAIYSLLIAIESFLAIDPVFRSSGFYVYFINMLVVFAYYMLMAGYLRFFNQRLPWSLFFIFTIVYVTYTISGLFAQVPLAIRVGVPDFFISLFLIIASIAIYKKGTHIEGFERYFIVIWPLVHAALFNTRIILALNLEGDARLWANGLTAILILMSFILLAAGILFLIASERRRQIVHSEETDYLTNSLSVNALYDQMKIRSGERNYAKNPLTLALVNIRSFSAINQKFGHDIGDEVLKKLATILINSVNENDLVARSSSDEFAVVLFNADALEAELVFNRISEQIYETRIEAGMSSVRFSVLIAIAVKQARSNETTDDLVAKCHSLLAEQRRHEGQQLTIDNAGIIERIEKIAAPDPSAPKLETP